MEQKNVKGIIALVLALVSLVLMGLAFVPMESLRNTSVKFFGGLNILFGALALVAAIAAVVFGAMGKKNTDKKAMAITGMVIGIISIILSIFTTGIVAILSTVTDYINNGSESWLAQNIQDESQLKEIDDALDQLFDQIDAQK